VFCGRQGVCCGLKKFFIYGVVGKVVAREVKVLQFAVIWE